MVVALSLLVSAALSADSPPNTATSAGGMIASVHPLATAAGVAALQKGGNAIDAAIAVGLTLGVVDARNSGLGGGCFILIRRADGRLVAIDGRETAPAKASRNMYLQDVQLQPELSQTGPLAVATPGALAAYALAVKEHGKLKLAELVNPAARLAEQGFPLDAPNAEALGKMAATLRKVNGPTVSLLKPDGTPYAAGETLKQPDLANTYRGIAEQGPDYFYRGAFASAVGNWMAEHGGLLSADDFAAYQPIVREPLVTTYRGRTIVGFPPPSSGGVHVAQMLNILENFDVAAIHRRDAGEYTHLLAEAMKLAFADRAHWLGDPDFARVPRGLIDKEYAKGLAAKINLARATPVAGHGTPPAADEHVFLKHTTHIAAADAEGNWVAMTQTVNTSYGSKVIVPGTGVVLNNEMDDFSIAPGQPNAFKLIGAEANAVAAGKRPLSSMSPTIVLENDRPILTVGAAGGPTIITQVLQALVRRLDLELPLTEAIGQARIHHQWCPDSVRIESRLEKPLQAALTSRGHTLDLVTNMGVSQAILFDRASGQFLGVHDPRIPGKAAGPTIAEENSNEYRPLFDGQSLAGWEGAGQPAEKCWKAEDGQIVCTGEKGPWLRSVEQFDDFNLRLEYKLKAGGNSGVYIRVPADGKHHGDGAGIEIQVLDDKAGRYRDIKPYQYTGSLYAIAPATSHVGKDVGEWNTLEINCRGMKYHVIHNGTTIIATDDSAFPELKGRLTKGHLGLQNHSEEVWFRNLRVGPARDLPVAAP